MKRLCAAALAALGVVSAASYPDEIRAWREQREQSLKAPGGWLSVAGLFWLKPGANAFGTDASNAMVLPAGSAPARAGVFTLAGGKVSVTVDGRTREVRLDADTVRVGRLELLPIRRGDRFGIRMKDNESALRRDFKGLKWYPVGASWRVTARFVDEPRKLPVPNVLGQTELLPCPGYAVFTVNGREVRLYPTQEGKRLFFVFRDQTAGKETYGAGRFLYSDVAQGGRSCWTSIRRTTLRAPSHPMRLVRCR
jgi:uncharacterized protein (DUF1684 family)